MDTHRATTLIRAWLATCGLALLSIPALADGLGDFFESLYQPGTGNSCCNISDCSFTKAWRDGRGQWFAIGRGGETLVIDPGIILERESPNGRAVICQSSAAVLCFVRPSPEA